MKTITFKEKEDKKNIQDVSGDKYDPQNQTKMLNKFYLELNFPESNDLKKSIHTKLQGYQQQDKKHHIYGPNHFISKEDAIQKLVESKLNCFYCQCKLMLFYTKVKQDNQWTLDRINNSMGHNTNNVVISCLGCNLKRGNIPKDKFLFTKQLIVSKDDSELVYS